MLDNDGRMAFLDFSICGRLDDRTRRIIRTGLPALLVQRNYEAVALAIRELGAVLGPFDDVPSDCADPTVTRRRSTRSESVNWWCMVLKETSELLRNDLERLRGAEAAVWAEQLATLREMFGGSQNRGWRQRRPGPRRG